LLVFYEAITRIAFGERDAALTLLRTLKSRKLGLIPVRDFGFESVWGDPEFQKLRKELADDEPRTPDAPVAFRLTNPKLIPEGIAYDAKGDRFFIGSVAQKKIVVTDRKGDARDFSKVEDKLDCVLGVIVDPAREQLYAVSTNGFLDEAKTQRRNAVVRYFAKNQMRKFSRRSEAKVRSLRPMASRLVWTEVFTSRSQPALQRSTLQPERQHDCPSPTLLRPAAATGSIGTKAI
jgi:hypothetical protein